MSGALVGVVEGGGGMGRLSLCGFSQGLCA